MHIVNANGQVACRSTVETLWLLVTVINADCMVLTSYHAQLLGPQVLLFIVPIIPCGSSTSLMKKRLHYIIRCGAGVECAIVHHGRTKSTVILF